MVLKPSSLRAPSPKRGDIGEAQSSNNSTPFASPMKPSQSLSSPAFGDSSAASGAPTSSLNSTPGNSLAGSPFHGDAPKPVHKKRAYGNPVFCRSPGKVQHRSLTGHASFYSPVCKRANQRIFLPWWFWQQAVQEERAVGGASCEVNRGSSSNPLYDEMGPQSQDTTLNDSYSRGEDNHGDTLVGDGDVVATAISRSPGKVRSRLLSIDFPGFFYVPFIE